jgi:hypothetical protein
VARRFRTLPNRKPSSPPPAPVCARTTPASARGQRQRVSERSSAFVGTVGQRTEAGTVTAAEIPERGLIAAASALGVRTQHGQWWLPG